MGLAPRERGLQELSLLPLSAMRGSASRSVAFLELHTLALLCHTRSLLIIVRIKFPFQTFQSTEFIVPAIKIYMNLQYVPNCKDGQ